MYPQQWRKQNTFRPHNKGVIDKQNGTIIYSLSDTKWTFQLGPFK